MTHQRCQWCPSRRGFLAGLPGLAASLVLEPSSGAAQTSGVNPRRIDFHNHITPASYIATAKANGLNLSGDWSVSQLLEDMDTGGTAVALTTIPVTVGPYLGSNDVARKLAREANESAAKLIQDHPGRFGMFAALPLPDIDGALREMEYAYDVLKADGMHLHTEYQDKAKGMEDRFLGHPMFRPLYQEMNRRKALVYTHPSEADCCRNLVPDVSLVTIEFGTNTTRTVASLILSGTTTMYPDIQWVHSHAGGTTPFLVERFLSGSAAEVVPGIVTKGQGGTGRVGDNPPKVPKGVLHELRKMYFDTAQSTNPIAMGALRLLSGADRIVYGTDFPFRTAAETGQGLTTSGVFNAAELRQIDRENAIRLIPRLRTV